LLHTLNLTGFFLSDASDSDDDVLTLKRKDHALEAGLVENEVNAEDLVLKRDEKAGKKSVTKAAVAKRIIKKKIVANKKTVFDEEGTVRFLLQFLSAIFYYVNILDRTRCH
jgi:hypothetical protein